MELVKFGLVVGAMVAVAKVAGLFGIALALGVLALVLTVRSLGRVTVRVTKRY